MFQVGDNVVIANKHSCYDGLEGVVDEVCEYNSYHIQLNDPDNESSLGTYFWESELDLVEDSDDEVGIDFLIIEDEGLPAITLRSLVDVLEYAERSNPSNKRAYRQIRAFIAEEFVLSMGCETE